MLRVFEIDGCALHVRVTGDKHAPAVVLSHGATLDAESWSAQLRPLADGYQVISWDMRGHGASQPLSGKLTFARCAEDLRIILDQLGVARTALVGLSMGSFVSQEFAYRYPDRVSALASIGATSVTGLKLSPLMSLALRFSDVILRAYPYRSLVEATAKGAAVTPAAQAYIRETVAKLSKQSFIDIWSAVQSGQRAEPDYRHPFPLLIAVGQHDNIGVTRRGAFQWRDSRPEAEFHLVPDAGHCANQDNAPYVTEMLLDFLARTWPGRPQGTIESGRA